MQSIPPLLTLLTLFSTKEKKKERNESIRHTHGSIGRAAALFFFFFFVIIIIHQKKKKKKKKKERKGERRANAPGTTPYAVYGGARAGKHLILTTTLRGCRCWCVCACVCSNMFERMNACALFLLFLVVATSSRRWLSANCAKPKEDALPLLFFFFSEWIFGRYLSRGKVIFFRRGWKLFIFPPIETYFSLNSWETISKIFLQTGFALLKTFDLICSSTRIVKSDVKFLSNK